MRTVGDRIRQIRKNLGLNQDEFSKEIGTIQSYLSEIETNKKIPSEKLIRAIAYRWNYNLAWLLEGKEQPQSPAPDFPYRPTESGTDSASPSVFEERRSFNRQSGLTREETELLARWLSGDREAKALLVEWARARLDDSFQNADAAELIEVVAKALASFLLNKRRRESAKGPPPGG